MQYQQHRRGQGAAEVSVIPKALPQLYVTLILLLEIVTIAGIVAVLSSPSRCTV